MSQALGFNGYVGIGEEGTYGTAVTPTVFPEIESENLKGKRIPMMTKTLGTLSRRRTVKSKAEVSGGFKFPLVWNGLEKILKHVFGASSFSTSGGGPNYTHDVTLKAALLTGLTLVANRDAANLGAGTMFRYKGCHINKLTLSQEIETPVMAEVEIVGSDFDNTTIVAATFPTWDPIEYGQMTLAQMHVAGATDLLIRKWSLSIDNKLESIYRLTDYKSKGVNRIDHREVSFEADIELQDLVVYAKLRDALTDDFKFKWVKDANTEMTLTLPKAFLDGDEPETGGPGPYYFSIKGQALMNAADNDELTLQLKNQTAGPI